MVDPEHIIDFSSSKPEEPNQFLQLDVIDKSRQRPVKRGRQGERLVRPSDERFGNNENFLVGEFTPVQNYAEGLGCGWLSGKFYWGIGRKPFTVNTVVQGLMAHQRIWTEA